jgi:hypothetical protein
MRIPAERAIILWNGSDGDSISLTELVVCDISEQGQWTDRLDNSRGACDLGWMKGGRWDASPMGIYTMIMAMESPVSRELQAVVLREFAKIEGQDWAVDMLREVAGEQDEER